MINYVHKDTYVYMHYTLQISTKYIIQSINDHGYRIQTLNNVVNAHVSSNISKEQYVLMRTIMHHIDA